MPTSVHVALLWQNDATPGTNYSVQFVDVLAQLMIRHPNFSGLAMDQVTRLYTPPHYVKHIDIAYGGKPVMSADTDISISENPNFRFYFMPKQEGTLTVEAIDSQDASYKAALPVKVN